MERAEQKMVQNRKTNTNHTQKLNIRRVYIRSSCIQNKHRAQVLISLFVLVSKLDLQLALFNLITPRRAHTFIKDLRLSLWDFVRHLFYKAQKKSIQIIQGHLLVGARLAMLSTSEILHLHSKCCTLFSLFD